MPVTGVPYLIYVNDSFTQAGTGLANITTHTAETGGAYSTTTYSAFSNQIDQDNDNLLGPTPTTSTRDAINYMASTSVWYADARWTYTRTGTETLNAGIFLRCIGSGSSCYQTSYYVLYNYVTISIGKVTANAYGVVASQAKALSGSVKMRVVVAGSSPTAIRVKAWTTTDEPSAWDIDTTDNTAGNQTTTGGYVAVYAASITTGTSYSRMDDLLIVNYLPRPGGVSTAVNRAAVF